MKNLITLIAVLTISFTAVFANTTPKTLISTSSIEVVAVESLSIFSSAEYNGLSNNLEFNTIEDISVIQIFDDNGQLAFQLPVMSNKVKVNKNLFSVGTYKLGFILDGKTALHFTEVTINN